MSFEPSILHPAIPIYQQGLEGNLDAHPQIQPNYQSLQVGCFCADAIRVAESVDGKSMHN